MKKVLFLSSRIPYPPIGGDKYKNYWLLKILAKHYKVHLVSLAERDIPAGFYKWVNELGITYKIFPKRKIDFYKSGLRFFFNKLPIQVNYYYFKDIQKYVDLIYKDFDILFSCLIRTSQYIINKEKPKILDITDSIGLNYKKSKNKTHSIKWKIIYIVETPKLLNFEKLCLEKFDKTLFVNMEEMDFFKKPFKTIWLPFGANEELLKYNKINFSYNNCVVFFGKMDYQPNIDAVLWFINNVLSLLDKSLIFIIMGSYPPKFIRELENKNKNIKITGFIKDPYEIIKSSLCVVAPMQTGGGIQSKILESMALGTINIVSSLAAKPIIAIDKKDFLVIDNPEEMAKTINDIYINPNGYNYLKLNSREYIKNNFTWSIYEPKILGIIEEVLQCNTSIICR